MSDGDENIPELTESERIRIRATEYDFAAMGDALRNGTATPEEVDGAFARFMSLDIDPHKHRNALHIPADAGPHAGALEMAMTFAMLRIFAAVGRQLGLRAIVVNGGHGRFGYRTAEVTTHYRGGLPVTRNNATPWGGIGPDSIRRVTSRSVCVHRSRTR